MEYWIRVVGFPEPITLNDAEADKVRTALTLTQTGIAYIVITSQPGSLIIPTGAITGFWSGPKRATAAADVAGGTEAVGAAR